MHPARGADLTATIMEVFWREATDAGRVGVPVIIPTGLDIAHFRAHTTWPYQPLVEALALRRVPVLDLGPIIEEKTRGAELSEFFAQGDISRHFGAKGYQLVAEAVEAHLRAINAPMPIPAGAPQDHAP
jgi:hypothetical protein